MRSDILPRGISPDYQLPDHTSTVRKLSEHRGDHPCCPMDTALYAYCGLGRRHREQMQGLILAQHEHQCSPRLLQRHRNGVVGESLTQLTTQASTASGVCTSSPLSRFSESAACKHHTCFLSAQSILTNAANCGSCFNALTSDLMAFAHLPHSFRLTEGRLCSREMLVVEP